MAVGHSELQAVILNTISTNIFICLFGPNVLQWMNNVSIDNVHLITAEKKGFKWESQHLQISKAAPGVQVCEWQVFGGGN